MEAAPESSRAGRTRRATATALVPSAHDALRADQGGDPAERLVRSFLRGRSARTLDAYRQDLEDFRAFLGAPTPAAAAGRLLGAGQGAANGLALDYKAALMARGLAAATVNRRLAAVRALVKMARTLGLVAWALDVESLPAAAYRDTRGPGRAGYRGLLQALEGRTDARTAPALDALMHGAAPQSRPAHMTGYIPGKTGLPSYVAKIVGILLRNKRFI